MIMKNTTFQRIVKSGVINFFRNGSVSVATVLVMSLSLLMLISVLLGGIFFDAFIQGLQDKVDVSVYFKVGAGEEDILSIKKSLEALPAVNKVTYLSDAEALAAFKTRHEGDALTLQALDELGANPLGAVLNIQAKDPSQYQAIATFLKEDSALSGGPSTIIDRINYFDNKVAIDRLTNIIRAAEQLGFALSAILITISVIIAFNTIRLAIFISKEEISVMRLVGASNKYVRGPFVISGILYGLFSGLVTLVIFYPLTRWVGEYTASLFSGINFFTYYTSHFGEFFLIIVGSGVVLGAVSSYLAVRRYLKV